MKNLRAQAVLRAMQAYVEDKAAKSAMKIALGLLIVNISLRYPLQWSQWIGTAGMMFLLVGISEIFSSRNNK